MYEKTNWVDHVVERNNTYAITENTDGTYTVVPEPGQVIQQGTSLNAENFNNMENGIEQAHEKLEEKLDKEGGTITGDLIIGGKATVTGGLDGSGEKIENIAAPENSDDAANKGYVDAARKFFHNVSVPVSAFVEDTTYEDYGYKADIALSGVTASMIPEVVFPVSDLGVAPVCESYNGGVRIWADDVPEEAITIPTIILWRGDDT